MDLGHGGYAIEDLRTKQMTATARGTVESPGSNVRQKAGLNRAILDRGWHQIDRLLSYKTEQAGARLVRVRPSGTSQECHRCGSSAPGQRESQALFRCVPTRGADGSGTPTTTPLVTSVFGAGNWPRRTWSPSASAGL